MNQSCLGVLVRISLRPRPAFTSAHLLRNEISPIARSLLRVLFWVRRKMEKGRRRMRLFGIKAIVFPAGMTEILCSQSFSCRRRRYIVVRDLSAAGYLFYWDLRDILRCHLLKSHAFFSLLISRILSPYFYLFLLFFRFIPLLTGYALCDIG